MKQGLEGIKNIIVVASGKGGVGKSTVSINLSMSLVSLGYHVGLLDADLYGPSLPTLIGSSKENSTPPQQPQVSNEGFVPLQKFGLSLMSIGFLIPEGQAVVWRGPMVHSALVQFMNQVMWGSLDFLIIDLPPGTGDTQLSLAQIAKIRGAIIVTTPQDISLVDVRKAIHMFKNVHIPILGVVENMSYFSCPSCQHTSYIFGQGGGKKLKEEFQLDLIEQIPINPLVAQMSDEGIPFVYAHPDDDLTKKYIHIAEFIQNRLDMKEDLDMEANMAPPLMWQ